jgi:hypothetical protein
MCTLALIMVKNRPKHTQVSFFSDKLDQTSLKIMGWLSTEAQLPQDISSIIVDYARQVSQHPYQNQPHRKTIYENTN